MPNRSPAGLLPPIVLKILPGAKGIHEVVRAALVRRQVTRRKPKACIASRGARLALSSTNTCSTAYQPHAAGSYQSMYLTHLCSGKG